VVGIDTASFHRRRRPCISRSARSRSCVYELGITIKYSGTVDSCLHGIGLLRMAAASAHWAFWRFRGSGQPSDLIGGAVVAVVKLVPALRHRRLLTRQQGEAAGSFRPLWWLCRRSAVVLHYRCRGRFGQPEPGQIPNCWGHPFLKVRSRASIRQQEYQASLILSVRRLPLNHANTDAAGPSSVLSAIPPARVSRLVARSSTSI